METVQRWTQIVGKVRMVNSPWLNHSWSVTPYVTPTGLTRPLSVRCSVVRHRTRGSAASVETEDVVAR